VEKEDTPVGVAFVDAGSELAFGSPAGTTGSWVPGVGEAIEVMTAVCRTIEGALLSPGNGASSVVAGTVVAITMGNGRDVGMVVTLVELALIPPPGDTTMPAEGES
jgi:hypothetical protein